MWVQIVTILSVGMYENRTGDRRDMDGADDSGTKKAATFRSRLLVKAFDLQAFYVLLQGFEEVVPAAGLEPAHPLRRGILNPLCLPISPRWHFVGSSLTL